MDGYVNDSKLFYNTPPNFYYVYYKKLEIQHFLCLHRNSPSVDFTKEVKGRARGEPSNIS